jgi:hypothetical protein
VITVTELTTAHQLLSKAIERQTIGAASALEVLLREQTAAAGPDIAHVGWRFVQWNDADAAELALRRFLQDYPV